MQFEIGQLSAADRQRFERHLMDCEFCLHEAISMRPTADAMVAFRGELVHKFESCGESVQSLLEQAAEKPKLQAITDDQIRRVIMPKSRASIFSWDSLFGPRGRVVLAAAAVLLVIAGTQLFDGNQAREIGAYAPPTWLAWQSRDVNSGDSLLNSAQSKYAVGDYTQTVPLLEQYLASHDDAQALLYLGVSYYQLKEYDYAMKALSRVKTSNSVVLGETMFYRALLLAQQGDNDEALAILDKVLKDRVTRTADAQALVSKLRGTSSN